MLRANLAADTEQVSRRRRFPRVNKWIVLAGVALALTLGAAWLAATNEPLNPEARKIIEQPFVVPAEKNMYFAIWGLRASSELVPSEVGKKIVAAYNQKVSQGETYESFDYRPFLGARNLPEMKSKEVRCTRDKDRGSCIAFWNDKGEEVDDELRAQALLLSRYKALRAYGAFEDAVLPFASSPVPEWEAARHASQLIDAKIAFDMADPNKRLDALVELEAELGLWQRIATGATTMLSRMIATTTMQNKYGLLSELLVEYPEITHTHGESVGRLSQPLPITSADMRRVFEGEFRMFSGTMLDMRRRPHRMATSSLGGQIAPWEEPVFGLLYKPNASVNKLFRTQREFSTLLAGDASKIAEGARALHEKYGDFQVTNPTSYFYNPIGEILTSITVPAYEQYAYRIHDLIAASRVVELQRQIVLKRTPPQAIDDFLSASDPTLHDPYTKAPMRFDAAKGTLSFNSPRRLDSGAVNFFAQVAPPKPALSPTGDHTPALPVAPALKN